MTWSKTVVVIADVRKVRIREAAIGIWLRRIVAVQADERAGAAGHRPEEQRVDEREHRAVRADGERQHEDDHDAEAGGTAGHP